MEKDRGRKGWKVKRGGTSELDGKRQTEGRAPTRTGLGGEDVLVVKEVLHPCHHVVDVGRRGELHVFAILVDPRVVETNGLRGHDQRKRAYVLLVLRTLVLRTSRGMTAPCSTRRGRRRIG